MSTSIETIDAKTLKAMLHDGDEVALLDAREEVPFDKRHILMACCVPPGRLELLVANLVPRKNTRVVWCDDGDGAAAACAARMRSFGYSAVAVLQGGIDAWESAGFKIYSGVHVPSKAFAEVVEHEAGTPWIDVHELKALIDDNADFALFDSRSYEEYHSNSIPGAISVPGAELVYRFADMVPSPHTKVVVNCGGRTRSIIGAQSLINAGVPNEVVSLKNGTQDWHLAGFEVVVGADRRPSEVTRQGREAAREMAQRVEKRFEITRVDAAGLARRRAQAASKNVYVLDVRTPEEYEQGHLPNTRSAPGGQLIQETDVFLGAWGGSVTLVDTDGVRAVMTASWLKQMGWQDVAVHTFAPAATATVAGEWRPRMLGAPDAANLSWVKPDELSSMLKAGTTQVVDLAYSNEYRRGHIPGAWYARRGALPAALDRVPESAVLVFTCPDGRLASLAAAQTSIAPRHPMIRVLAGGTAAWKAAGHGLETGATHMASDANDVRLKAREMGADVEDAMRAYLAWEIDLVNQMAADDDQRFCVVKP